MTHRSAMMKFSLKRPYELSMIQFSNLAGIWRIRIWKAATHKRVVEASMPIATYKQMFKSDPRKGKLEVPLVLQEFLDGIEVTDIRNV